MKKVLITGASGMTGSMVLENCLKSNEVESVISLVRTSSNRKDKKLKEIIVADFSNYSHVEKYFEDIDIVYFCIGVYTGKVSDEDFKKITVDYTVAMVEILKIKCPNVRFCFLSGAGADRTEKSKMAFAKYKGMAENYIIQNLQNVHMFRPGYIYPVQKRKEPNMVYNISRTIYPLLKLLGRNATIKSTDLGLGIFMGGFGKTNKIILENRDIRDLVST
ncbi:MAG: NAD-dependent epimerase/dehydratase family protein [Bacteroidales bacterium]|nr:NAD-dependent epimerase/dehydratase family protein [Bacteroidales bacterium]